jgi:hypothetical protein
VGPECGNGVGAEAAPARHGQRVNFLLANGIVGASVGTKPELLRKQPLEPRNLTLVSWPYMVHRVERTYLEYYTLHHLF